MCPRPLSGLPNMPKVMTGRRRGRYGTGSGKGLGVIRQHEKQKKKKQITEDLKGKMTSYPIQRNCGQCAKLRTPFCDRPDECVSHEYKDFRQTKPWKTCRKCNGPMRRLRSDPVSETLVITHLRCADCGLEAKESREYIETKGRQRHG